MNGMLPKNHQLMFRKMNQDIRELLHMAIFPSTVSSIVLMEFQIIKISADHSEIQHYIVRAIQINIATRLCSVY